MLQAIVVKMLFGLMLRTSRTYDEVRESSCCIDLHEVSQDRSYANFNHGFGMQMALLRDPRSKSAD